MIEKMHFHICIIYTKYVFSTVNISIVHYIIQILFKWIHVNEQ